MNLFGLALLGLAAARAMAPKPVTLVVDTFEGSGTTPVLTHEFHGRDAQQAEALYRVHMKYDQFLRQCDQGRFLPAGSTTGFACRNVRRPQR